MYEVGVRAQFEAAHRLVGDFGPATRLHGHTYQLEVAVRGSALNESNVLCDVGALRSLVDDVVRSLHYKNLDEVPGLVGKNTTAEAVADYCWHTLAPGLQNQALSSLTVRIWESPQVYALREGEL